MRKNEDEIQAKQIADFILHIRKKVKRFIVHCEFGQSRSAGVAAAIQANILKGTMMVFLGIASIG